MLDISFSLNPRSIGHAAPIQRWRACDVISNHQNYWYWGPRDYTGESVIVLGSDGTGDREHFASVEAAGRTYHPYSRRDEHFEIFVCRGLNAPLQTLWPKMKKWD